MRQRRIALVVTAETTVVHFLGGFASYLATKGWQVEVIAGSDGGLQHWGSATGVETKAIPFVRDPSPVRDLVALRALTAHLRRTKPDVVAAATPKAALLAMLAAAASGIEARVHLVWGLRLETAKQPSRSVYWAMEWLTTTLATLRIANSRSLAARMAALRLAPLNRVLVLGEGSSHGVDLARFRPGVCPAAGLPSSRESTLQVVFVGRLHPDKGIETLTKAVEHCTADGFEVRAMLVGPQEGWDPESVSAAIRSRIVVVGEQADVRPWIASADVLCLPSKREGFPNVVLEAAAMGVPAVVSDATGAVDAVVRDVTGLVVPVGSAEDLAVALERLADSPELRARLGTAARSWVEAHFAQEEVWAAHERVLRDEADRHA